MDSQITILKNSLNALSDLDKINTLIKLSEVCKKKYPKESFSYSEEALKLASQISIKNLETIKNLGNLSLQNGKLDEAIEYFRKGLELAKKNKEEIAFLNFKVGGVYFSKFDYELSLKYYFKAFKLAFRQKNSDLKFDILEEISYTYFQLNDYAKSFKVLFKELELILKDSDLERYGKVLNNIGVIYQNQLPPDFSKALEYFQNALSVGKEIKSSSIIATSTANMGVFYLRKEEPSKALDNFQVALEIQEKMELKLPTTKSLLNIGTCLIMLKNPNEALEYLQKALKLSTELSDVRLIGITKRTLGLAEFEKKNFSNALEYFHQAINIAESISQKKQLKSLFLNVAGTYEAIEDFKNAFKYYQKYHEITVDIFTEQNLEKLNEIETKFQTKIYQLQNNQLKNLNRELIETQEKLIESERKRTFLATVIAANHEMNQPLTSLLGNVNLLQMHLKQTEDEKSKKYLERIELSTERISSILQKLQEIEDPTLVEYFGSLKMIDINKKN